MTVAPIPDPNQVGTVDRITTLRDLIVFADSGRGTLEEVAGALTRPINIQQFRRLLTQIEKVTIAKWRSGSRRKKAEFTAAQNRRKGKLFEQLIGMILDSCHAFRIYGNVQTLTNEIDWLVYLDPLSIVIPALRSWGTHFLCECKMTKNGFQGEWVTRLYALTRTHGTEVAVLFTSTEVGNTGGSGKPQRAIQDYALIAQPGYILRIGIGELTTYVESGKSPLVLIANRFVELKSRRAKVGLLAS